MEILKSQNPLVPAVLMWTTLYGCKTYRPTVHVQVVLLQQDQRHLISLMWYPLWKKRSNCTWGRKWGCKATSSNTISAEMSLLPPAITTSCCQMNEHFRSDGMLFAKRAEWNLIQRLQQVPGLTCVLFSQTQNDILRDQTFEYDESTWMVYSSLDMTEERGTFEWLKRDITWEPKSKVTQPVVEIWMLSTYQN